MTDIPNDDAYPVDARNRVRRRPLRGHYDHASVHAVLDAGFLCHIAYVIDGQPYCTPTSYWREGEHIYWHGSAASRMLRAQGKGLPVCLTVTHVDALALARSGFNHSVNYRAAMVYGTASLVPEAESAALLDRFIDRLYPDRAASLRPATSSEIKQTALAVMRIEQASAKIRDALFVDDEEDYALPVWTALIRTRTVVSEIVECPRMPGGTERPAALEGFQVGAGLDELLAGFARQP